MADTEDDIVINVADEKKAEPTGVKVDPDPAVAEVQAQYDKLKADRENDRSRLEAAERQATEARRAAATAQQEAHFARTAVSDSQVSGITSELEAHESAAASAQQAWKSAFDAGNTDEMSTQMRRLSDASSAVRMLNERKADLEARRAQPQQQPQPQQPSDPFDAYLQGRTEPTQNWLRAHREWVTDPRKNSRLTGAHHLAVADGLSPDTEEYFAAVEKTIGLREAPAANGAARPQAAKRTAPPVAPVSGGSSGSGAGGQEVRLSKGEAERATDGTLIWNFDDPSGQKKFRKGDPIGVQEMARRKLAMQKQGLYDKSQYEAS